MAPRDREPSNEDKSRMDEIRNAQTSRPAGDPRVTGIRGLPGHPFHVYIEDAADKFFHSFRAPRPDQGPQRPEELTGHRGQNETGEALFRAVLTDQQAITQAAKSTVTEMKLAADMAVRFAGGMGQFTTALRAEHEAERTRIDSVLTRIEQHYDAMSRNDTAGGGSGRRRGGEPPAPPSEPIGHPPTHPVPDLDNPNPDGSFPPAPPVPPGGSGGGSGGRGGGGGGRGPQGPVQGPAPPPAPDTRYERLSTHAAAHRRATHGGLRRRITQRAAEDYHQRFGQGTDRSPTVVPVTDPETGELSHYEERGPDGEVLNTVAANDPEAPSMARRVVRAAAVSRAAGAMANGQGLGGMLRGAASGGAEAAGAAGGAVGEAAGGAAAASGAVAGLATKAIPVVGWALAALDVVGKGFHFAQDQRAKNVAYQSVLGGANTEGFGQRVQEEGFKWGQFLTTGLKDEDASKLFKGVTSMGYMDSQRGDMLDFAQKQYKNMGMSVDQSLAAINIASQGANSGLVGLESALTKVTKAARTTGQNADTLRSQFLNVFQAATSGGYGVQSASVAGSVVAASSGRSRDMANIDYSGMFSDNSQRLQAAQMGMSLGQFVAQNAEGGGTLGLEAKDKQISSVVNTLLTPNLKSLMDQKVAEAGGVDEVKNSPEKRRQIGLDLMKTGQLDPAVIKQLASVYGIDMSGVSLDDTGEWLVDQSTGGGSLGAQGAADDKAKQQRPLGADEQQSPTPWLGALGKPGGSNFVNDNWGANPFSGAVRNKNSDLASYRDLQTKTKATDPGIEAAITSLGHYSEVGIEVQTKQGKKTVSQSDAIKYYPDQVAQGDVTVVGGPADVDGRKLSELTGVSESNFAIDGKDSDTTGTDANKDAPGVSADDWKKDHNSSYADQGGGSSGDGKISIDMTDDVKKYFKISGSGSVSNPQVERGASSGLPPSLGGN